MLLLSPCILVYTIFLLTFFLFSILYIGNMLSLSTHSSRSLYVCAYSWKHNKKEDFLTLCVFFCFHENNKIKENIFGSEARWIESIEMLWAQLVECECKWHFNNFLKILKAEIREMNFWRIIKVSCWIYTYKL